MSEFHSEYGGAPGLIQPDVDGVHPDAAAAGLGHAADENRAADREGVGEAAMIVRTAGLREARGVPAETIVDPDTGVYSYVQHDENTVREQLREGNKR